MNRILQKKIKLLESAFSQMNYSFRKKNKIVKYIVIHYTGMKNLKLAYQKLTNKSSNVSAHYLITRKGIIFTLPPLEITKSLPIISLII